MTAGAQVRVTPLTRWAKNKVAQHGDVFVVGGTGSRGVLLWSMKATFKINGGYDLWCGWFDEQDAKLESI